MKFDIAELREKKALFSEDRVYRYCLWREWNAPENDLALFINEAAESRVANKGFANWLCLNPSKADELTDDRTVSKCIRLSKKWGYSGFCMTNLFAFRATEPEDMKAQANPVGPENDTYIVEIAKLSSILICGWGNDGAHMGRAYHVNKLLFAAGIKLHHLKMTEKNHPYHPLYLKETLIPKLIA